MLNLNFPFWVEVDLPYPKVELSTKGRSSMIAIFARVNMPEQEKRASAFGKVHLFYLLYPCRAKTCFVSPALQLQNEGVCLHSCMFYISIQLNPRRILSGIKQNICYESWNNFKNSTLVKISHFHRAINP